MFLETVTFGMFALVIALKYGAVNRIMKLNQRLRDVEFRCRKQKDNLKLHRSERLVAERDEAGLERKRAALEAELRTLSETHEKLKEENRDTIEELLRKNARLSPELREHSDPETTDVDELE